MWARTGLVFSLMMVACGPGTGSTGTDPSGSSSSSDETSPGMTSAPGSATVAMTSTATTVATTVADSTDTGSNFVDPSAGCGETETDGGSLAECDVWAQDCCEGDKCVAWANDGGVVPNATRCVEIAPDAAGSGEPCTTMDSPVSGLDDCDAGSYCFDVDPVTLMGECVTLCEGSAEAPECPDGTGCVIANDGVLTLCLELCDPLDPQCDRGQACQWASEDGLFCAPHTGGKFGVGDPCEANWGCDPADSCVEAALFVGCAGAVGCCSPYCDALDPGGDAPCTAIDMAMTCVPVFGPGEAPVGLEHLGACSLP